MELYDPTVAGPELNSSRAPSLISLEGKTVGYLHNGKLNAINMLRETAALFETLRKAVGLGLSVIFISHKLGEVMAITHRVIVLRHGRVVEEGAAGDIFSRPQQDYTKQLMTAAFVAAASRARRSAVSAAGSTST